MSDFNVSVDRDKFIGGSDVATIMGISPFKTRWQLLLEKAGLAADHFMGNRYTEYGDLLEPKIRDYVNTWYFTDFQPARKINGDIRCHVDGDNGEMILEIKTTSQIYNSIEGYKRYLVQLLLYLTEYGYEKGFLAVYDRPADFTPEFNVERLQIYEVRVEEYKSLIKEIYAEIDRFRADLTKLKENPLLTEEDFQPKEIVALSQKAVALEKRMAEFKVLEKQYKEMKRELYEAMVRADIKKWEMPNGTKITKVDEIPTTAKVVEEFDVELFKKFEPQMYKDYLKEVTQEIAGKAGYVKITIPKG